MNGKSDLFQGSHSSTSTLRPRSARLISYLDEEDIGPNGADNSISTSFPSRSPARLPTRTASPTTTNSRTRPLVSNGGINSQQTPHERSTSEDTSRKTSNGLWDSWSSIQGIASTFLGGDVSATGSVSRNSATKKTSLWMKQDKSYGSLKAAPPWGPKGDEPAVGGLGTVEERQALVQAKRREALLISGDLENKDTMGRYKRKGSDANFSTVRGALIEEDALVYRHKIRPGDTLAGVIIKYNCQPEVFRKVNRFWPNDNIQTRKTVLLPVDACALRGRKVETPAAPDLLGAELANLQLKLPVEESIEDGSYGFLPDTEVVVSTPSSPPNLNPDEDDYKHDSWVSLPSFTQPIEVLRIPKRTLGYFPPARRKSNTPFSDISADSTPKTSFDTLRHPPSHAAQQAQIQHQNSLSLDASPVRRPMVPAHLSSFSRQRASSTASAPGTGANTFLTALQGPGGVGTLRGLRTEIARPGPAEDPLNKKFAPYIPDLHPPPEDFLSSSFNKSRTFSSSLRVTPRASTESVRSSHSNSSTVPAAIEGWMKKLTGTSSASTASGAAVSPARRRAGINRVNSGNLFVTVGDAHLVGDLIELDVNPDSHSSGDGRDHTPNEDEDAELTPRATPMLSKGKAADRHLDERFPIRGRVTRAYDDD